ncbi:aspartate--tRNA(Asn) ligase [Methanopyrus sp. KOL6]|uniref:aspartate--tRNA(Asn) ligase n=1 Tax=Methanopyrus sp. KOL6 TaxID=1937004 RepID=UPI000B4B5834|nr:aspartate--tRNA(Asn) ligase [Methanopyrus sp. KOL6]
MLKDAYTADVTPERDGEEVRLAGWVHEVRDLGGIKFVLLRDRTGIVQLTLPRQKVPKETFEKVPKLTKESVIRVEGIVQANKKAPRGVEIIPRRIEVLSKSNTHLPLDPTGKVDADLDTRLDARVLDLRREEPQAIFKIRNVVTSAIREFLEELGFIEVHTPKIIASATEGGTELFPVVYFERDAYLAQSPQLYKQMLMAAGFERVYEIGPIFRAEEHNTRRHLNEAISVDIEMSFIESEEDVMRVLEKLLAHIFRKVREECERELKVLNQELPELEVPFERITYEEALNLLSDHGIEVEWGEDLPTEAERKLGEIFEEPFFITEWPKEIRPFYTMAKDDEVTTAFDLMYKGLELASGAQREHRYDMLVRQIEEQGLNPADFKYYLESFKYGMPPHGGWGLGLERTLMTITDAENIREVTLFPRDRKRLHP